MVDLGGSLAVASMGYYSTGVSTDLNGTCANGLITERTLIATAASHVSKGCWKGGRHD